MPVSGKYLIINVVYHIVVYFRLISCKSATAVKKLLAIKRNEIFTPGCWSTSDAAKVIQAWYSV